MSSTSLQCLSVAGSLLTVELLTGDAASLLDMFGALLGVSSSYLRGVCVAYVWWMFAMFVKCNDGPFFLGNTHFS